MKKLILILALLSFSILPISAQIRDDAPQFDDGVLTLTGVEWMNTDQDVKAGFVVGYLFGLNTFYHYAGDMLESESFNEILLSVYPDVNMDSISDLLDMLRDWAWYEESTGEIVYMLDRVFSKPENREYSVFEVLLVELSKNWWSLE